MKAAFCQWSSVLTRLQEPSDHHQPPLGAHVSLTSAKPSLVLEEIEHLLSEIHCEDDYLYLGIEPSSFVEVRRVFDSHSEVLVITSHETCNDRGSRLPYMYVG